MIKTGTLQKADGNSAFPDHMPTAGIALLIVVQGTFLVTVSRYSPCLKLSK